MTDDTTLPFHFPSVRSKKLIAAFDGGRLSSDGGVMLLAEAARRMGIAEKLAAVIPDRRDPTRVVHPLPEILQARTLAIACGYEDADDLDSLRTDPAFKLACGRLPESGVDLMSQPTVSRWENAPTLRDLVRLGRVMVDLYCESYAAPPEAVVLDIDDTLDVVHGHQQLSSRPIQSMASRCLSEYRRKATRSAAWPLKVRASRAAKFIFPERRRGFRSSFARSWASRTPVTTIRSTAFRSS
jgi:hypothetical protein